MRYDDGMKFALDHNDGGNSVSGYETGRIRIRGQIFECSVLVTADQLQTDWPPTGIAELTSRHLQPILALKPNVVILGTGERQQFPDPRTFIPLMDAGIGYEVMDTAAACRTYNVLLSEGRKVLGAFLL